MRVSYQKPRYFLNIVIFISGFGLIHACSSDFSRMSYNSNGKCSLLSSEQSSVIIPISPKQEIPIVSQNVLSYPEVENKELSPLIIDNSKKDLNKSNSSQNQYISYTIKSGDTLFSIAHKNNISVDELKRINNISQNVIFSGKTLFIPKYFSKPLKSKNLTNEKKQRNVFFENLENFYRLEKLKSSHKKKPKKLEEISKPPSFLPNVNNSNLMVWPVIGTIVSNYGDKEEDTINDGIDILVPKNTKVYSADSGTVIYADNGLREFGKTILIRHDKDLITVYGYNSTILVHIGQFVQKGEEIARSGTTKELSPRLHFEVRKNSHPENPKNYLEKK